MFIYTYQCDACDFRDSAICGRIGYYIFTDGERIPASTVAASCRKCGVFTCAENLPTADAVVGEIERLRNNQTNEFDVELSAMFERDLDEYVSSRLAVFTELDRRFRNRKSANRCIECGMTDFEYLRDDRNEMPEKWPHANCHGTLRLVESLIANPASYFTLDSEGNRVVSSE